MNASTSNTNNYTSDESAEIPKDAITRIIGMPFNSYALNPRYSVVQNNIEYEETLRNPDQSLVHKIECNEFYDACHMHELYSWKRKEVYATDK